MFKLPIKSQFARGKAAFFKNVFSSAAIASGITVSYYGLKLLIHNYNLANLYKVDFRSKLNYDEALKNLPKMFAAIFFLYTSIQSVRGINKAFPKESFIRFNEFVEKNCPSLKNNRAAYEQWYLPLWRLYGGNNRLIQNYFTAQLKTIQGLVPAKSTKI